MTAAEIVALSSAEQAARTIYLCHTGYNGLVRRNQRGQNNVAFGGEPRFNEQKRRALSHRIKQAWKPLQTAQIRHADFEDTVRDAGAGSLVFIDSPYFGQFSDYNAGGFGIEDHRRLARDPGAVLRRAVAPPGTSHPEKPGGEGR
jgi:DNA adenine methylase